ncbi:UNVERIFIED_CONTAM: putative carboxylesterase 12 [Sesamum radiatum]|uniref:Carboxylesterase 12 n=1 Tax=Sesamum radiatum TaxID=300843 RepID=A0AAW2MV66_SESRA
MASDSKQVALDLSPFFRLFTDRTIHRMIPDDFLPPSDHPNAPVRSKDVVLHPHTGNFVRVYARPTRICPTNSPLSLAPENPLPIPFDDSWAAFQWIAAHADGTGPEPWLNDYADFRRVFVGGESAGATIASDVAIRAGVHDFQNLQILGLFLLHPFFGGKEEDKLYKFLCPSSSSRDDDPRLNPAVDPRIERMVRRVIFFVAEKDQLREGGRGYFEALKKSGWRGDAEIMETEGEGHCFYLFNPTCEKAVAIMDRLLAFLRVHIKPQVFHRGA